MKYKILLIIICLLFLINQASAGQYSINGTTYDTTWDGRVIPSSQIVYGSNDDVILVQELIPATAFTVGNETIYINNNHTSFKREKFKISPILTYPKTTLLNKMVSINSTTAYLTFPYSLSRVKDFISDNEIRMGNWTFRAGQEHIDIYDDNQTSLNGTQNILPKSAYTFRIINDEIRLYFLKSEANKLQGNITFEMNSWTINGSTTPAWQNTSGDAVIRGNGKITNDLEVSRYISWWDFTKGSGTILWDVNRTSSNDGTFNGNAIWNVSGGVDFDGTGDYIEMPDTVSLSQTENLTIIIDIFMNSTVPNQNIFGKGRTDGQRSYMISYASDNSIFYLTPDGTQANRWYNATSTSYLAQKEWFKALYEFDTSLSPQNRMKIYNYTVSQTTSGAGTIGTTIHDSTESLRIGSGMNSDFKGIIKRAILYNKILSTNEKKSVLDNNYSSSNNRTAWYDSGSGNEVYQIDVNATTPANTNYTLTVMNNDTDAVIQTWTNQTGNNSFTITSAVQDTKINVTLNGNQTATPELMQVTFFDQAAGEPNINISSWSNNFTNDNSLSLNISVPNNSTLFNISTNIIGNTYSWELSDIDDMYLLVLTDYDNETAINWSELPKLGVWYLNSTVSNTSTLSSDSKIWVINLTELLNNSPNITSWSNSNTSDTNLSLFVSSGTNITFNFTTNQTLTTCSWGGATQINCTGYNSFASHNFTSMGVFYVTASGTNLNGTTQTITWEISVGGVISFDGYIFNSLGLPIQNARLDILGDGYQYTNSAGHFQFNNLSGLTHETLIRAIGYENLSTTHINILPSESMNYTLNEKIWATQEDTDKAGALGFIGGIMGGMIVISIIKKYKK